MVLFVILVLPKNYLADNENYLADSGARNGLCRAQPRRSEKVRVYENQCQDKTNPSLVTGLRCKPYTRNLFDYRWLCELVLGWRVFRGNNCVTRAKERSVLVEVVVDFFTGIQFVRWRYRWGRVFLFLDLINSLIIPQGYFALRYTILERIAQ